MLLKKFLITLAIALYSVVPVVAGDNDRARGHGQGHGAKMGNLKAGEAGLISRYKREYQLAVGRSLTPDQRPLVDVPSHRFPMGQSKGTGLHWDKGDGKGWGKGYGKNSNKRYGMGTDKGGKRGDKGGKHGDKGAGMRWDKGEGKGWCKGYGKNSNKRYGMGGDKGAGKREDQSRGDNWQKNRKKKYFDTD